MARICVCAMYTVQDEGLNLADDDVSRNLFSWKEKHVTFILIPTFNDTEL